ncbi:hypothetical protein T05_6213 [Trichinella murrelli]|uniref:Uncharacterized protein n=1 Tax=Trichinella murrelli TaxID=144512 RepID=A0A0V0TSE9_9BILA|nr:hypothetical protein T05_6213 [Trichinella murrelli]
MKHCRKPGIRQKQRSRWMRRRLHHCTPLSLTCCIGNGVSSKLRFIHFVCRVLIYTTALCVIFRINLNDHFVVP